MITKFVIVFCLLSGLDLASTSTVVAQTGTLRGSKLKLNTGTNSITLVMPASPKTWTLTFPHDTAFGLQYLFDDGTGTLHWGVPVAATSTGSVLYNTTTPQVLTSLATPLFNIGYNSASSGPAVGALIKVVGSGTSNSTYTGLTDSARNANNSTVHPGYVSGLIDTVANLGNGTQTGLQVTVSGGGNNYAATTYSGNVGINTGSPAEQLEVSGNIRISGTNGLKITEGTNALMGTIVMNGTTAVTVSTTSVTANSRIYLTPQNVGACNCVGMPYVNGRTAGTSFTVKSTGAGDNSTVAWIIIEP